MVWVRLPVYFYKRNETFYFSRAIPSDLLHRFNKRKIEVSLRTKSEAKAAKSDAETALVTPVRGPRSLELGSGKVAGKVLIVDHM